MTVTQEIVRSDSVPRPNPLEGASTDRSHPGPKIPAGEDSWTRPFRSLGAWRRRMGGSLVFCLFFAGFVSLFGWLGDFVCLLCLFLFVFVLFIRCVLLICLFIDLFICVFVFVDLFRCLCVCFSLFIYLLIHLFM